MTSKLTLALDSKIIAKAKNYAKKKNTSLSGMVENFLAKVVQSEQDQQEDFTPLVKKLSGVITLSPDIDPKKAYGDHLTDKYNR